MGGVARTAWSFSPHGMMVALAGRVGPDEQIATVFFGVLPGAQVEIAAWLDPTHDGSLTQVERCVRPKVGLAFGPLVFDRTRLFAGNGERYAKGGRSSFPIVPTWWNGTIPRNPEHTSNPLTSNRQNLDEVAATHLGLVQGHL